MIIPENIRIKIKSNKFKYYRKLFSTVNIGDVIEINTVQLHSKSALKIKVKCDICKKIYYKAKWEHVYHNRYYPKDICKICSNKKNKSIIKNIEENYNKELKNGII